MRRGTAGTRAAAVAIAGALALSACTGGGSSASTAASTSSPNESVAPVTSGLPGDGGPSSARSTITTTPTAALSTGTTAAEQDGTCPYISAADFHEFEGDRVGRVTVLRTKPVGCRFYFDGAWGDPNAIVGEVLAQDFADSKTAFNSMVASSKGHPEVQSDANLINGIAAVAYRTSLQGEDTWQCLITVGRRVYTVRTRQVSPARDAFNLAAAVVRTVHRGNN